MNLLGNTPLQPSTFETKDWVEINDASRGTSKEVNQIRFKTSILRSILCVYSDAYNSVKGRIMNTLALAGTRNNTNKNVVLENCAPFTNCISRTNNTQVVDAHNIGVVMLIHNRIEYRHN